jgi:hypothetical protein
MSESNYDDKPNDEESNTVVERNGSYPVEKRRGDDGAQTVFHSLFAALGAVITTLASLAATFAAKDMQEAAMATIGAIALLALALITAVVLYIRRAR